MCIPCFACPAREPGTIRGQNSQGHNTFGQGPCGFHLSPTRQQHY